MPQPIPRPKVTRDSIDWKSLERYLRHNPPPYFIGDLFAGGMGHMDYCPCEYCIAESTAGESWDDEEPPNK